MSDHPIVLEIVPQKDVYDCGIACLAMLCGVSWGDVRKQIRFKAPTGLSIYEMKAIAKRLGLPLSQAKNVHTEDIGIMHMHRPADPNKHDGNWDGHYVVYMKGILYNPAQGQLWTDPYAYVTTGRWEVVGILKRKD